jgi:hypothetical protein
MAEALTEREQKCLEHVKQAQELGVSFAEFCRSFDLNVNSWYSVRQGLVRKGLIDGRTRTEELEEAKQAPVAPAGFAEVRIAAPPTDPAVMCRIRHPNGWVIECAKWPEASWMATLFAADEHAAT